MKMVPLWMVPAEILDLAVVVADDPSWRFSSVAAGHPRVEPSGAGAAQEVGVPRARSAQYVALARPDAPPQPLIHLQPVADAFGLLLLGVWQTVA